MADFDTEPLDIEFEFSKSWHGFEVRFGRLRGTGEAVAVRVKEPVFCVVRPSYEECIDRAEAAIAFYHGAAYTPR